MRFPTVLNAAEPAPMQKEPAKTKRSLVPMAIIVLLALAVIGTGVAYAETAGGPTSYACLSIAHNGSTVTVTTVGLLHYVNSQYYVSCPEGASLPTGFYTSSCLTISPQNIPATIGVGAATEYYYIATSAGHTLALQGASPLSNGGEIITMAGVSLVASC